MKGVVALVILFVAAVSYAQSTLKISGVVRHAPYHLKKNDVGRTLLIPKPESGYKVYVAKVSQVGRQPASVGAPVGKNTFTLDSRRWEVVTSAQELDDYRHIRIEAP
ncbi:hypothetical protein [Pseudobdellovibrio exovorus]|uniref:Uncharacterized protein n=1 Tax=Pseudobdellovibrio exovorus JSS TaxID=1184267 RepID=M4VDR5_9BACT|nr:hypothetical protein [Pseudobdellovibrio exovorus]AGH96181.1 hypothetical protein A11Q_1965 [Pseudobdellovibrio exovorus JSS]